MLVGSVEWSISRANFCSLVSGRVASGHAPKPNPAPLQLSRSGAPLPDLRTYLMLHFTDDACNATFFLRRLPPLRCFTSFVDCTLVCSPPAPSCSCTFFLAAGAAAGAGAAGGGANGGGGSSAKRIAAAVPVSSQERGGGSCLVGTADARGIKLAKQAFKLYFSCQEPRGQWDDGERREKRERE